MDATIGLVEMNHFWIWAIRIVGVGALGNFPVVYVADPNAEGLMPADPTKPGVAYSADGSGSFYGWNTTTLTWV